MNILMISQMPMTNDNSFGSTYLNIFTGFKNLNFFIIRNGFRGKDDLKKYKAFQITEKSILKNFFFKNEPSGKELKHNSRHAKMSSIENKLFDFVRLYKFQIFLWFRDLIWGLGNWKSHELDAFLEKYNFDIIFQPIGEEGYQNDLIQYVKKKTKLKMIGYISDDCYTLKQFSLSPLYWIDRLWKRRKVKKAIDQCELLYVISDIQKKEYESIFGIECKVLTKGIDPTKKPSKWKPPLGPLKLYYAGILNPGRISSLCKIVDALEKLNNEGHKVILRINTPSPISQKYKKILNRKNISQLKGSVSAEKVYLFQKEADILIHIEGTSLKEKFKARHSFSTKLVDYFGLGKAIFAYGPANVASLEHLKSNQAAQIANDEKDIYFKLHHLITNNHYIQKLATASYKCGLLNHNQQNILKMVNNDILRVLKKKNFIYFNKK